MSKITVYSHPISQPSRSASIVLVAAGVDHDEKLIALDKKEQKEEWYLKINSRGKVPALQDEGFVLTEGAAILQYVAEKYDNSNVLYPTDAQVRARVNEWLHWTHSGVRKAVTGGLIFPMFVLKQTPPPENFEAAKASLGEIEEHLKNHKYLATEDKPTIADLFVVPEVDQAFIVKLIPDEGFPNISRWLKDLRENLKGYAENVARVEAVVASLAKQA